MAFQGPPTSATVLPKHAISYLTCPGATGTSQYAVVASRPFTLGTPCGIVTNSLHNCATHFTNSGCEICLLGKPAHIINEIHTRTDGPTPGVYTEQYAVGHDHLQFNQHLLQALQAHYQGQMTAAQARANGNVAPPAPANPGNDSRLHLMNELPDACRPLLPMVCQVDNLKGCVDNRITFINSETTMKGMCGNLFNGLHNFATHIKTCNRCRPLFQEKHEKKTPKKIAQHY